VQEGDFVKVEDFTTEAWNYGYLRYTDSRWLTITEGKNFYDYERLRVDIDHRVVDVQRQGVSIPHKLKLRPIIEPARVIQFKRA
jgi:hypothetical protein